MATIISDELQYELFKRMPKKMILSSVTKKEGHEYRPVLEAMELDFFRFNEGGNLYFISIDVDFKLNQQEVEQICKSYSVPLPTMIVDTTKGVHIHWMLDNFVSKNATHAQNYYNDIKKQIIKIFKADPHASGNVRIFRNPLKHNTMYRNVAYCLSDFKEMLTLMRKSEVKKCKRSRGVLRRTVNLSAVKEGERNVSLFNYIKKFGYAVWGNASQNLLVEKEAFVANNMFDSPLDDQEVMDIVKSVTTWLDIHYDATKRSKYDKSGITAYNRKLAKKRAENTLNKVASFYYNKAGESCLAIAKNIPLRVVAVMARVSKNSVAKYKSIIIKDMMDGLLAEVKASKVQWAALNNFTCDVTKPVVSIFTGTPTNTPIELSKIKQDDKEKINARI
jgi:hypothetical protein